MKEKTIVGHIMKELRSHGFWTQKIHGNPYQAAGLPDILAIKAGRAYWIEVKRPGQRPTRVQRKRLADLFQVGCVVGVATSVDEALEIVSQERGVYE